ncbi:MAG: glycosyltransferase family 4 protein [Candidatus Peribacteraceae bacterium]|nr:glycosyltransferase family 4 protein [Candidatus Peribacteraceae bacterium]
MNRVDVIANVTAANVDIYAQHGHRHSSYVGNTWIADGSRTSSRVPEPPYKIIGHVGHLARTGTAYGLRFLLKEVLPHLSGLFGGKSYQVHIIGAGEAPLSLRPLLQQPSVVLRGFVKDLDAEFAGADAFCMFNNVGSYIAAYTRHIIAWSQSLCLVAHARSTLAIPEIVHGENALIGSTGREVAELIVRAVTDPDLNRRIREGGRRTYERFFTPQRIAEKLSGELMRAAGMTRS